MIYILHQATFISNLMSFQNRFTVEKTLDKINFAILYFDFHTTLMRNVMEIINLRYQCFSHKFLLRSGYFTQKNTFCIFQLRKKCIQKSTRKGHIPFSLAVSENIRINFRTVMNAVKRDIYTEFSNYVPSISSMTISSFCQYSLLFSS